MTTLLDEIGQLRQGPPSNGTLLDELRPQGQPQSDVRNLAAFIPAGVQGPRRGEGNVTGTKSLDPDAAQAMRPISEQDIAADRRRRETAAAEWTKRASPIAAELRGRMEKEYNDIEDAWAQSMSARGMWGKTAQEFRNLGSELSKTPAVATPPEKLIHKAEVSEWMKAGIEALEAGTEKEKREAQVMRIMYDRLEAAHKDPTETFLKHYVNTASFGLSGFVPGMEPPEATPGQAAVGGAASLAAMMTPGMPAGKLFAWGVRPLEEAGAAVVTKMPRLFKLMERPVLGRLAQVPIETAKVKIGSAIYEAMTPESIVRVAKGEDPGEIMAQQFKSATTIDPMTIAFGVIFGFARKPGEARHASAMRLASELNSHELLREAYQGHPVEVGQAAEMLEAVEIAKAQIRAEAYGTADREQSARIEELGSRTSFDPAKPPFAPLGGSPRVEVPFNRPEPSARPPEGETRQDTPGSTIPVEAAPEAVQTAIVQAPAKPGGKDIHVAVRPAPEAAAAEPGKGAAREPWEMTREEYFDAREVELNAAWKRMGLPPGELDPDAANRLHEREVVRALDRFENGEGKPVPARVLDEYRGQPWADAALAKMKGTATPSEVKATREAGIGKEASAATIVAENLARPASEGGMGERPEPPKAPKRIVPQEAIDKAKQNVKDILGESGTKMREGFGALEDAAKIVRNLSVIGAGKLEDIIRKTGRISYLAWRKAMMADWQDLPARVYRELVKQLDPAWRAIREDKGRWERFRTIATPEKTGEKIVTARQALKAVMRGQERAADAAYEMGQTDRRTAQRLLSDVIRRKLPDDAQTDLLASVAEASTQQRLERLAEGIDARIRQQGLKDAVDRVLGQDAITQKDIAKLATKYLPAEERGRLLIQLANAKTPEQMKEFRQNLHAIGDRVEWKDARKSLKDALADLKKFHVGEKGYSATGLRAMRPIYREKVKALLDDLDTGRLTPRAKAGLQALVKHLQENPDNMVPPEAVALTERLGARNIYDMRPSEIRAIADSIQQYMHVNKVHNKLLLNRRAVDMAETAKAGKAEIEAGAKEAFGPGEKTQTGVVRGFFREGSQKAELQAERLGPTSHRILQRDLRVGDNDYLGMVFSASDRLLAIGKANGLTPEAMKALGGKAAKQTMKLDSGQQVELTTAERIQVELMSRDPDLLAKVLANGMRSGGNALNPVEKWTSIDFMRNREAMSPADTAVADFIHEWYNTTGREAMNRWSMENYGFEIAHRKNYTPSHTDLSESQRDVPTGLQQLRGAILENMGITKARQKHGNPMLRGNAFNEFWHHVNSVARLTQLATPVRNARMYLGNPEVRNAILSRYGGRQLRYWENHIRTVEAAGVRPTGVLAKGAQTLSSLIARGTLGFRLTSRLKQAGSFAVLNTELPWEYLGPAYREAFNPKLDAEMDTHSPATRLRYSGSAVHLVTPLYGESPSIFGRAGRWEKAKEYPMEARLLGIQRGDREVLRVTWAACKRMVSAQKPALTGDAYWREVSLLHEQTVGRTQNTTRPVDFNGIELEARENPLARIPIFFSNQANQIYTMFNRGVMRYQRSDHGPAAKSRLAADIAMLGLQAGWSVAVGAAWTLTRDRLRHGAWSDEDDKKRRTIQDVIAKNTLREVGGYVYFGDDAATFAYDVLTKGGYMAEAPQNIVVNRVYRSAKGFLEIIGSLAEGETTFKSGPNKGESKRKVMAIRGTKDFLLNLAVTLGIPAEPPYDYAEMAWRLVNGPKEDAGRRAGPRSASPPLPPAPPRPPRPGAS